MSRPAWMPTGNEVVRQLILAAVVGAVWWAIHQQLQRRQR